MRSKIYPKIDSGVKISKSTFLIPKFVSHDSEQLLKKIKIKKRILVANPMTISPKTAEWRLKMWWGHLMPPYKIGFKKVFYVFLRP